MKKENLSVIYKGEALYKLNPNLIKRQNISDDVIELIKQKHIEKLEIFDKMKSEISNSELKFLANEVEKIEFELQELWGFNKDKNMHEWYLVPKCTCPKIDNAESRGTEFRIVNSECPIHG